jgi:hypothetical protein
LVEAVLAPLELAVCDGLCFKAGKNAGECGSEVVQTALADVVAIEVVERVGTLCGRLERVGLEILSRRGAIPQTLERRCRDGVLRCMRYLVGEESFVRLVDPVEEGCNDVRMRDVKGGWSGSHGRVRRTLGGDC